MKAYFQLLKCARTLLLKTSIQSDDAVFLPTELRLELLRWLGCAYHLNVHTIHNILNFASDSATVGMSQRSFFECINDIYINDIYRFIHTGALFSIQFNLITDIIDIDTKRPVCGFAVDNIRTLVAISLIGGGIFSIFIGSILGLFSTASWASGLLLPGLLVFASGMIANILGLALSVVPDDRCRACPNNNYYFYIPSLFRIRKLNHLTTLLQCLDSHTDKSSESPNQTGQIVINTETISACSKNTYTMLVDDFLDHEGDTNQSSFLPRPHDEMSLNENPNALLLERDALAREPTIEEIDANTKVASTIHFGV